MTGPLCGAVSQHPEDDVTCLCVLDKHDPETEHQCGCGRQWTDTPKTRERRSA